MHEATATSKEEENEEATFHTSAINAKIGTNGEEGA